MSIRRLRWRTPKRCCSSMATKPRREGCRFFRGLQAADQEFDAIVAAFENAARGKKMLHGENFRGGHQRGLATVFDGNDRGLQGDDGFAAADVALQEAIHGTGFFEVGGDFR